MQDGTLVHCTTKAKKFLAEKFRDTVISRGTDNAWPSHSPGLEQLYFYFWIVAQRIVYETKPSAIAELINVMEQFVFESNKEVLENIALDVLDWATLCLQINGGNF